MPIPLDRFLYFEFFQLCCLIDVHTILMMQKGFTDLFLHKNIAIHRMLKIGCV